MRPNLRKLISACLIIIIFYFLLKNLVVNWRNIPFKELKLDFSLLILSFFLLFLTFLIFVAAWRSILKSLGETLGFSSSFWIMTASQMGKYVPGKIWFILGRIYMAKQEKLSGVNVALSVLVETILTLLCGMILVVISIFLSQAKIHIPLWSLFLLVVAGIVILHPSILNTITNFFLRLFKKDTIHIPFSFTRMLALSIYYWGLWATQIIGFFFLVNSIYRVSIIHYASIIFVYTTSWIVGFIAPFAPGGLGVREGIMSLGLSTIMPPGLAIGISFLTRIWITVFEVIIFVIGFIVKPGKKRGETNGQKR